VMVLSDGYLANSSEPWRIPDVATLPRETIDFASADDAESFQPYSRNDETLARPWAIPGTAGLEHRIGGLTKANISGNVVYDAEHHAEMVELRAEKVRRVVQDIPNLEIHGPDQGELLLVGWGSTEGAIIAAVDESAEVARELGCSISRIHVRHMHPLPANLGEILRSYKHVLLPELNDGQLSRILRAEYLVDIEPLTKVAGQPFRVGEIQERIESILRKEKS